MEITERNLLKIRIQADPFPPETVERLQSAIREQYHFTEGEEAYLFIEAKVKNHARSSPTAPMRMTACWSRARRPVP